MYFYKKMELIMFTKNFFRFIGAFLIFAASGCSNTKPISAEKSGEQQHWDEYITVDGGQFRLGDSPYYFVGTNFWYGAYLGVGKANQQRLLSELDQLKSLGITNLRILAGSEASALRMAVSPAIMQKPGVYDETLLSGLDFLLDEMAKRDMKAVLFFSNFWQWSGGMAQLVGWDQNESPHDPDVQGDWNGFMQYSAQFYSSERAKKWYNDYVLHLVNRINTVNGKHYKKDTAIMSWELANEPRPGSDEGGHQQYEAFKQWISETARYIKTLDSNHLVTTGSEGSMGAARRLDWFEESHTSPDIDYLTVHIWPANWSWYDPKNPNQTFSEALVKSKAYFLEHVEVAKRLNKPLVLEEFGMNRDGGSFTPDSTTKYRNSFMKSLYELIEQQIRIGGPVAGSNVWAWGGVGRTQNEEYIWRKGDSFMGDPPQEPQGLYSIIDTDKATIALMSAHAANLKRQHR